MWQRHWSHEPDWERLEQQNTKPTLHTVVHSFDLTQLLCFLGVAFGVENMATAMDEDLEDELEEKEEKSMMCQPGMHKWKLDQCMVCTVCGDCTGYGASCVSSGRPDRVPGG